MVIVGNGCAGAECIKALRESGYSEKVHLFTDSRWPVSNPMLTTYYVSGKIGFDQLFPYGTSQEFCLKYRVDAHAENPVVALDAKQRIVYAKSDLELKYDKCLIATGAAPVLPPVKGVGSNRIYTMRTLEDAIRLKETMSKRPQKALVIGASVVGIKLVELFHDAGMEACLADLAEHIFPLSAHPECARVIEERLLRKGIKLRLGAEIERVEETAGGVRAYFKGSPPSEEADLLMMATGVKPNTGFINRRQVAVDRGILVDGYMRTNMPGLYAAGDVAQQGHLPLGESQTRGLWSNARYQGRTAGRNMAGGSVLFPENISHSITHFMGMDFVGIGSVRDYDKMEKTSDGKVFIQLFWKDGLLTGANFLDSYTESGTIKHGLIKGLKRQGPVLPGLLPSIQNQLIRTILLEVQKK
jgi:NAD(P)H-nitrite reductase large subunit